MTDPCADMKRYWEDRIGTELVKDMSSCLKGEQRIILPWTRSVYVPMEILVRLKSYLQLRRCRLFVSLD